MLIIPATRWSRLARRSNDLSRERRSWRRRRRSPPPRRLRRPTERRKVTLSRRRAAGNRWGRSSRDCSCCFDCSDFRSENTRWVSSSRSTRRCFWRRCSDARRTTTTRSSGGGGGCDWFSSCWQSWPNQSTLPSLFSFSSLLPSTTPKSCSPRCLRRRWSQSDWFLCLNNHRIIINNFHNYFHKL